MNYSTGCAFNLDDIFLKIDKSKLKLTSNLCQKINNNRHKDFLIKKIFRKSVEIILKDIIDNNVTFELPGQRASIYVKRYSDDDFGKGRRNGKWKEIDFLKSYFSGYQLVLNMLGKDGKVPKVKPVYISNKLKQILIENTNNGKQYC